MTITYGITDKEKEKIATLFDNVGIYTAGENQVNITLKGIGEFNISWKEHQSKPSYISGLPYAYKYFKSKGKELDFMDLINMDINKGDFYGNLPDVARHGLTFLLTYLKLDFIYKGLNGENYENKNDLEIGLLYESAKAFGNKSSDELKKMYNKFENSFIDGGFMGMFNNLFGKQFLENNEPLLLKFQEKLYNSVRYNSFTTSVGNNIFDLFFGFRGNEYIQLLKKLDKYKFN